jgi:hypothetical protein
MFVLYDARSYDPIRSDKGLKERMLVEYVCEDWVGSSAFSLCDRFSPSIRYLVANCATPRNARRDSVHQSTRFGSKVA